MSLFSLMKTGFNTDYFQNHTTDNNCKPAIISVHTLYQARH